MKVNGEDVENVCGMTIEQFLKIRGYDSSKSAVLLNGKVVPRAEFGSVPLRSSDDMEIVSFVGGG